MNIVPQVVLIGYIGHGKTTLFNKICKQHQDVSPGGDSVTRSVFLSPSAYGDGFNILDTPGLGSDKDKLGHVVGIASALSEGSIHQILIVIKFERFAAMKTILLPMIAQQFQRFRDIITVVVTHWDLATKDPVERQQELQTWLTHYNVNSILFISFNTTGKEICNMIDKVIAVSTQGKNPEETMKKMKGRKCELLQTEIQSYFDLVELEDDIKLQLNDAKAKITVSFNKTAQTILKFIKDYPINAVMPEVMHLLTLEIKKLATQCITEFQIKNMDLFNKLYEQIQDEKLTFYVDTQLKAELSIIVNELITKAQEKMKLQNEQCFNFIKRCPNCGEIWLKVKGCDDLTYCGNFPEDEDQKFKDQKIPRRFEFTFSDQVTVKDLGEVKAKDVKMNTNNNVKKRIGCNKEFRWSDLPPLQSNLIKELYSAGVLDYLANVETLEISLKQIELSSKIQSLQSQKKIIILPQQK